METSIKPFLRHLLSTQDLSRDAILKILDTAQQWVAPNGKLLLPPPLLKDKTVVNLFFENSTRTRTSFELAAKRLGAHVINFEVSNSSTKKGESLEDTIDNLRAMHTDIFVIRHSDSFAPAKIAKHIDAHTSALLPAAKVINAGDGCNEHPTQALLDAFTIRHFKKDFSNLSIAIVGDILHSRVANSNLHALTTLGVPDIRLVGPAALLPAKISSPNVSIHHDLASGIQDADVVMMLRIQRERMQEAALPNAEEYFLQFGLIPEKLKLAKSNALVMHPGPMNRGVEIANAVADGPQSVILAQAAFGVAVRMAVMMGSSPAL